MGTGGTGIDATTRNRVCSSNRAHASLLDSSKNLWIPEASLHVSKMPFCASRVLT